MSNYNKKKSPEEIRQESQALDERIQKSIQNKIKKRQESLSYLRQENESLKRKNNQLSKQLADFKNENLQGNDRFEMVQDQLKKAREQVQKAQADLAVEMNKNSELLLEVQNIKNKFISENNDVFKETLEQKALEAEQILKNKIEEYRLRFNNELVEAKKYAIESKASDLVEIIGKFETALSYSSDHEAVRNYVMGFNMFLNMFQQLLSDLGINKLNIKKGDEFSPNQMEAFESEVVNDVNLVNKVLQIFSPGYKLHDRVIKHALVKVGTKR